MKNKNMSLMNIIIFVVLLWLTSSGLMFLIEHNNTGANIKTMADAMWWSIITLTAIAYGDRYPVTDLGKVLSVIVIVLGLSVVGYVLRNAANWALGKSDPVLPDLNELHNDIRDIKEDLGAIEDTVEKLVEDKEKTNEIDKG